MMNLPKVKAAPGVLLIEPIKLNTSDKSLVWDTSNTQESRGMIVTGRVIAVGDPVITDFGAKIEPPCKVGDTVWYLEYSGGYDIAVIEGKKYAFSLFKDIRSVME